MNLVYYLPFLFLGLLSVCKELSKKRTDKIILFLLVVLYILAICSRIGHDNDYNDLNAYLLRYDQDEVIYWEPGFVFFVSIVKLLFGYNPNALIASVGVFDTLLLLLAYKILSLGGTTNESGKELKGIIINKYGFLSFFYFFVLYWGCSFGCEVIRLGISICFLFCSTAACIVGKRWLSLVFLPFAFLFQYSSLFYIVGLFVMFFIKTIGKGPLWVIFFLTIIIDFFFAIGVVSSSIGETLLGRVLSFGDIFSHFDAYVNEKGSSSETMLSLQYWGYHLFGAAMLLGNLKNSHYNRAVCFYYIGLIIGTVFSGSLFVMRLQWLYLPMVVIVMYYFAKDPRYSIASKLIVILGYTLIESVMSVRYLGYYV